MITREFAAQAGGFISLAGRFDTTYRNVFYHDVWRHENQTSDRAAASTRVDQSDGAAVAVPEQDRPLDA